MDLLDPATTQRPLDVLVLLSYPVSLSVAAAASVWTWLAVAVAGVWIWRLISHQSAAVVRAKEETLSTTSQLVPPEPTTTTCLLQQQQQQPRRRTQSSLPCSPPCPKDEQEQVVEEIEPARPMRHDHRCPIAASVVDLPQPFITGTKAVVYFEGHGGRCRGSPAPGREVQDEQDQVVVVAPSSGRRWQDEALISCHSSPKHSLWSFPKVVRCWGQVHREADQDRGTGACGGDAVTGMAAYRRMSDLGFRRFQDWEVINGNVVRLWHAL